MTTVQITLPDQLAQEAQRAGLLSPARLEKWLRDQLKDQHVEELFSAASKMAGVEAQVAMSPEDVAHEASFTDDLLFGMWHDREDMADVAGYVRKVRASRFNEDGSRQD